MFSITILTYPYLTHITAASNTVIDDVSN